MKFFWRYLIVLGLVIFPLSTASAGTVAWTDWTSASVTPPTVNGTLTFGAQTVDVQFSGAYYSAQTSGGTNYWTNPTIYTSPTVDNAPPTSDIIALGAGGTASITFSQTVQDPLLALVSWNGNTVDFGVPIEILSYGAGYWGSGTPVLNVDKDGFYGSGEVHGVIQLPGAYDAISFTHTSEYWHGFTVGARDVVVPLPASIWLLGSGFFALMGLRGFRKSS